MKMLKHKIKHSTKRKGFFDFSNRGFWFIVLIVLFVGGFRLFFSLGDSNFSDGSAYTTLRNVDSALHNFKPLYYDDLSYSGKMVPGLGLFYYLMALVSFGNIYLLKIIPELLFVLVSVIVYFIAKEMTGDNISAFFAGLISGFIPIYLEQTLNRISELSVIIPLILFLLYCALKLEKKFYLWGYVVASFLLAFFSPLSLLFVLAMWTYMFLLGGGFLTASKIKQEGILFSSVLIFLINLIIYKNTLFRYGASLIWQNIPANVLIDNFRQIGIFDVVLNIGLIAIIFGGLGIYFGINKKKKKIVYLFGAFMMSVLLLLVFRLISLQTGLLFFGIALAIFSSLGIRELLDFLLRTKLMGLYRAILVLIFILIVVSLVVPSYNSSMENKLPDRIVADMQFAAENFDKGTVVLGNIYEGELISGIAGMKNVADVNFVSAPKPVERLRDIRIIYSTWSEAKVLELVRKYNIGAIYFSKQTRSLYNIEELKYIGNEDCFKREGNFYVIKC